MPRHPIRLISPRNCSGGFFCFHSRVLEAFCPKAFGNLPGSGFSIAERKKRHAGPTEIPENSQERKGFFAAFP